MANYTFSKNIDSDKLKAELIALSLTPINITTEKANPLATMNVTITYAAPLSNANFDILNNAVMAHSTAKSQDQLIAESILSAQRFGRQLQNKFIVDNVKLGITQAGMTGKVNDVMARVEQRLNNGSLKDAISELKAIDNADKDATFITNARLLSAVNELETYLGISPLSTEL